MVQPAAKSDSRPTHQGEVLVYIYAIAGQCNCSNLPPREVIEARLHQMKAKVAAPRGVHPPAPFEYWTKGP